MCVQSGGHAAITLSGSTGQTSSSISSSALFQGNSRGIALIDAGNVTVSNNVIAATHGHCCSADGIAASDNVFQGNLGIAPAVTSLGNYSDLWPAIFYASNWNNSYRQAFLSSM